MEISDKLNETIELSTLWSNKLEEFVGKHVELLTLVVPEMLCRYMHITFCMLITSSAVYVSVNTHSICGGIRIPCKL